MPVYLTWLQGPSRYRVVQLLVASLLKTVHFNLQTWFVNGPKVF